MITVILNVYKRPHTLERQITAIKSQSINVADENIWIWYNKSDVTQPPPKNSKHRTFRCNQNTKFHGRFAAAMLVQTEYVAMFDDDVMPGKNWLKNCLQTMNQTPALLGGSGVCLKENNLYNPNEKFGWNGTHYINAAPVDLVGHAWFWKTTWSKYMWYEKPVSWENGEDIMFSYLLQKYGGIPTYVPPHPENDKSMWSSDPDFGFKIGNDNNASWLKNVDHNSLRDQIVSNCVNNGWKLIKDSFI